MSQLPLYSASAIRNDGNELFSLKGIIYHAILWIWRLAQCTPASTTTRLGRLPNKIYPKIEGSPAGYRMRNTLEIDGNGTPQTIAAAICGDRSLLVITSSTGRFDHPCLRHLLVPFPRSRSQTCQAPARDLVSAESHN